MLGPYQKPFCVIPVCPLVGQRGIKIQVLTLFLHLLSFTQSTHLVLGRSLRSQPQSYLTLSLLRDIHLQHLFPIIIVGGVSNRLKYTCLQ